MIDESEYENECKRCNVEKWKKALRIAEIRKETNYSYEQAERIYNEEQCKKDKQRDFFPSCVNL